MSLTPGSTLGPYTIFAELGHGGMGVVYTAQDPRLKRQVAIKILTPDLTRDTTAKQRFLQEAQAASALDHPNICTIFEINETDDGQLYLVMAYYEGETLKERIERGPLALDQAIDIATQVGQGLAEAHGAGIVHRDIKPANLLIAKGGVVKILDFGLAKLVGAEGVTQTGTAVGTVAYMSPEQARGEDVDHRTDIWSLGVVLYEMLSGGPPFPGENLLAISGAIQQDPTPVLTGASASLSAIVIRSLHKSQSQRYQAVVELLDELRNTSASTAPVTTQPDLPSIAVLPFADMSPEKDQDYFCEGMAEELIDALARLEGLRVVARTSAFRFKGDAPDLREVGEKLNVKTVLEGSIRKAGNRLRINAQLINTEDGYHLWSARYDRDMDDVFAVQDEIARMVVGKLKVTLLGGNEAPLVQRSASDPAAYNLFLKGRYYWQKQTRGSLTKSLEYFSRALAAEPAYARACAGIAMVQALFGVLNFAPPRRVMPKAREAARQALAIDDTVAEAHQALAFVLQYDEWDWSGADREYRRAIELNPGDSIGRSHYATLLVSWRGTADAALAEARRAIELDPLSEFGAFSLGLVLNCARQFDAARDQARQMLELHPANPLAYWNLGVATAAQGKFQEAVTQFRQGLTHAPGDSHLEAYLAWASALAGQKEEAAKIIRALQDRRQRKYFGGFLLAVANVGLGEHDQAMDWLSAAHEDRDCLLSYLNTWWVFDPLRPDPRFRALLRRMNFPQR